MEQGADTESEQRQAWSRACQKVEHPPVYSWAANGCSLVLFCQGSLFLWRCCEKQHTGEGKHLFSGGITAPVGRNTKQYHLPLTVFTCTLRSSYRHFSPAGLYYRLCASGMLLQKTHTKASGMLLPSIITWGPSRAPRCCVQPHRAQQTQLLRAPLLGHDHWLTPYPAIHQEQTQ